MLGSQVPRQITWPDTRKAISCGKKTGFVRRNDGPISVDHHASWSAELRKQGCVNLMGIGAGDVTPQSTVEAAVSGSGRPTLLVPEDAPIVTFGNVIIAWDGSRVAARAVSDARDFLRRAQTDDRVGYRRKGASGQ